MHITLFTVTVLKIYNARNVHYKSSALTVNITWGRSLHDTSCSLIPAKSQGDGHKSGDY